MLTSRRTLTAEFVSCILPSSQGHGLNRRKVGWIGGLGTRSAVGWRYVFHSVLLLVWIALLPNTSFGQAILTNDYSTSGGGAGTDLVINRNGGTPPTVFLMFDLSRIPPESNVSRATLKLFVNGNSGGNANQYQSDYFQFDVRDIPNIWDERGTSPQTNGALLFGSGPVWVPGPNNFIAIDVTTLVRDWISGARFNRGVALGLRSGPRNLLYFDSKENTLWGNAPTLDLVLDRITGVSGVDGLVGGGTTGVLTVGLADSGVTTPKLADAAITSQKIAGGAVGTAQLSIGAVGSNNIAPGAVGTSQLGIAAVDSANIAPSAVGNEQLRSGAVNSIHIAPGAVGSAQLGSEAVTSTNIAGGSVGSAQLADSAVNAAHIAANAVSSTHIASGQVVKTLNGLADGVNLVAGDNVTIGSSGNTLTISAAGGGGATSSTPFNPLQIALLRWYEANEITDPVGVGFDPRHLAFDGTHVWATNYNSNTVSKVRTSDGAVMGTFTVGANPWGIAFDGSNIWVANNTAGTVTKLRASDGATLGTFAIGGAPLVGVAFDGKNIWVVQNGPNRVAKLNRDGSVVGTYSVGVFPYGVVSDGVNIWVANAGTGNVTKLRASDGTFLGSFNTGVDASALAFDGVHIWVSNFTSGNVTKLRASDGTNMGSVPVGPGATGVAFDGNHIWVASRFASTVTKIRAADNQVIGSYATGAWPSGVVFDGANVWVANELSQTLVKR